MKNKSLFDIEQKMVNIDSDAQNAKTVGRTLIFFYYKGSAYTNNNGDLTA